MSYSVSKFRVRAQTRATTRQGAIHSAHLAGSVTRVEFKEHHIPHALRREAHTTGLVHSVRVEEKPASCGACHRNHLVRLPDIGVAEAGQEVPTPHRTVIQHVLGSTGHLCAVEAVSFTCKADPSRLGLESRTQAARLSRNISSACQLHTMQVGHLRGSPIFADIMQIDKRLDSPAASIVMP